MRSTPGQALALAQGWIDRIGQTMKGNDARTGEKPIAEIEYSDEGDWSLSIESGSNIYMIHPEDHTYTRFVVLRQTWTDLEVLFKHVSLEEALGRCA